MLGTTRFARAVHHDDDVREYAYDDPQILNAAAADGWTVLSMPDDFARLWPGDTSPVTLGDRRACPAGPQSFLAGGMVSASQRSWLSCPCA